MGTEVIAAASAPTALSGVAAYTQANVGGAFFAGAGSSGDYNAYSYAQASPTAATVASLVTSTGTPKTYAALEGATVFGAGILGGNGSALSTTYTATAQYVLNLSGKNDVIVGLLNMVGFSNGFTGLTFAVKDGGTAVVSDSFTSLSSAETFFTDHPLTPTGLQNLTGTQDLTLSYVITTSVGSGAGITFVLGDKVVSATEPRRGSAVPAALWTFDSAGAVGVGARPVVRIPQRIAATGLVKGPRR